MALAAIIVLTGIVVFIGYFLIVYDNGFSGFARLAVIPRPPEERPEGSLTTVYFPAIDGTRLEGWLLRPRNAPAPLVIMAPGLTGTKEGHLEPFAWRFVREGLAVLVIDFRCFGGSDGEPRHWVDPFRQVEDYQAALRFAASSLAKDGSIDSSRIALWGSSFSGGTAIVAAADSPMVAAVVAQCPFVDTPKDLQPSGLVLARYVFWTVLDLARSRLRESLDIRLPPIYIPAFGQPGEFAFATSRENPSRHDPSQEGSTFWQTLPAVLRGGWENKLLVRFLADFDKFQPKGRISAVKCPIYLVAAEADDMVPRRFIDEVHGMASHDQKKLTVHSCGHFDLYVEPVFHMNADLQASFLVAQLGTSVEPAAQRGDAAGGASRRS